MSSLDRDQYIAGVDIGGSHITVGLVDRMEIKVNPTSIIRCRINSKGTAGEILNVWITTIRELIKKSPVAVGEVGFAMPGPFDYDNGICLIKGFNKYESLYQMNIREILAEALSLRAADIRFRNDAEAFLAGELYGGAAKGYNNAIGITLGTGLGSAVSCDGITADAEMSVTEYQGEIIEEFVSTRGLQRTYAELSGKKVKDALELALLVKTDEDAKQTFAKFAERLSWFLEKFIQGTNPEVLVIGGNIALAWELFMPEVTATLKNKLQTIPDIVQASLAEDAALVGAACIFETQYEKVQE